MNFSKLINIVKAYLNFISSKLSSKKSSLSTLQHVVYVSYRIVGENEIHAAKRVLKLSNKSNAYNRFILAISSGLDTTKYLPLELNKTEQYLKFKSSIHQRISFVESYKRNIYLESVNRLKIFLTVFTFVSFIIPFVFTFFSFFLFRDSISFLSYFILFYPVFLSLFLRLAKVEDEYVIK
ncbi:MAG: hypothetical protein QXS21_00945 [Thermoproteota archaeon]|nr:hypothetical protein [Candidatus Brockarchaeota archaeon]